ncbi:MAG: chemotaxis protein CheA [Myxococcaceae bacterium]
MSAGSRGNPEFLAEATEILDALGADLHALDQHRGEDVDPDLLNAIFRSAHSLKGLAGMFGEDRIAQLAHHTEDLLDRLRLGKTPLSNHVVDVLISTADVLQGQIAEAARGESSSELGAHARRIAENLARLAAGPLPEASPETTADLLDGLGLDESVRAVLTEYEEHRLREILRKGLLVWRVRVVFDLSNFDARLAELNARLKPLGEVVSTLPSSSDPGRANGIGFELLLGSAREEGELVAAVEPYGAAATRLGDRVEAPPPSLKSPTRTVRVDIARLDRLMNAVGELLLTRSNLQKLAEASPHAASKAWRQELVREIRQLQRKVDELQKGILDVRMVPLGQVFDKLARRVRRVAREAGKDLEFRVSGAEVQLDKLIVEELSDPLMHIIHNAIAHGVETPEERARQGKPRRATVSLRARQQGNHAVIEVQDDGPGIDDERVRESAMKQGLLTVEQAAALSRRELQGMIFLPGISTAGTVSELSGRGVGLDVVKTNIANLSGLINLDSEPGKGTTLAITLPLTLAIIRALMVDVSGRSYAVPLNSVVELVAVESADLQPVEGGEVLELRGETIPVVRLARLFGHPERASSRLYVVVVGLAQARLGIAVDELHGQQDIVTKPLGGLLRHVRGISGAAQVGNRRIVLVLDVGALVDEVF